MFYAKDWDGPRLRRCLRSKDSKGLAEFIRARHHERFLKPIRRLNSAKGNEDGSGFASMALCCLLIETLQSYKEGLPTTSSTEMKKLPQRIPSWCRVTRTNLRGQKVFQRFFRQNKKFFPGMSGGRFYKNVRCGLLHQGQTRRGWRIWKGGSIIFDKKMRIVYRDNFAKQLEQCFENYLGKLRASKSKHRTYKNAAKKVWWLMRLS